MACWQQHKTCAISHIPFQSFASVSTACPPQLLHDALWDMLDCCSSKIACARLRSCQFIHAILQRLPKPLEGELSIKVQEVLVQRLDDRDAKVRRMAVHAACALLGMLQVTCAWVGDWLQSR